VADDTQLREGQVLTGTAEANNLEWVTPSHPLFEALRRHGYDSGQDAFARAACLRSLARNEPARVDFYRARAVDGLGQVVHERLFAVELRAGSTPRLRGRGVLADMTPAPVPNGLPTVARLPEETAWLNEHGLVPFVEEVQFDRLAEVGRVAEHVELSLTEILQRLDEDIGRAADEVAGGAEGRLALAERRHAEVLTRRERRREELERQRAVTLLRVNGRPRMMRPPTWFSFGSGVLWRHVHGRTRNRQGYIRPESRRETVRTSDASIRSVLRFRMGGVARHDLSDPNDRSRRILREPELPTRPNRATHRSVALRLPPDTNA